MSVNSVLYLCRRFLRRAFRLPRPQLNSIENFVLTSVLDVLPESERTVLTKQIAALDVVQRSPGKRITALYFDRDIQLLNNQRDEVCLATLKVKGNGSTAASIILHRGRLSSIEFKRSPTALGAGPYSAHDLALNGAWRSAAAAIDRTEHGRTHA